MVDERVIEPGQLWRHTFSGLRIRVTHVEADGWVGVYYVPMRGQRRAAKNGVLSPYAGYQDVDLIENFERVS